MTIINKGTTSSVVRDGPPDGRTITQLVVSPKKSLTPRREDCLTLSGNVTLTMILNLLGYFNPSKRDLERSITN